MSVTRKSPGNGSVQDAGIGEGAAEAATLNGEIEWIWYRDGENTQQAPVTTANPNRDGPIQKAGLDLLEKDEVKAKRPRMWNIVFYNDDYTSMDFVEFVLKRVFHLPTLDALALTLVVHTKGKGIAGTYTFEVAEQKQCEVLLMAKIEEHPLRVEVEPA